MVKKIKTLESVSFKGFIQMVRAKGLEPSHRKILDPKRA